MSGEYADLVGGDPGATTALVRVRFPVLRPAIGQPALDLSGGRWLGSEVFSGSASAKLSRAERQASLGERASEVLLAWVRGQDARPDLLVMEEPVDGAAFWGKQRGGRREGRGQKRGTEFAIGAAYGAVVTAARLIGFRIASYPINNFGDRLGWMQGGAPHPQKREDVLARLAPIARAMGAPSAGLSEDELCAFGVLLFHAQLRIPPGPLPPPPRAVVARKAPAKKAAAQSAPDAAIPRTIWKD